MQVPESQKNPLPRVAFKPQAQRGPAGLAQNRTAGTTCGVERLELARIVPFPTFCLFTEDHRVSV